MRRAFADFLDEAHHCLMCTMPSEKVSQVFVLGDRWRGIEGFSHLQMGEVGDVKEIPVPGRPQKPALVPPSQVARRGLGSVAGRRAFFHALAHIEFNAINLALDAIYRFRDMPWPYYLDWLRVAVEEAQHFQLLTHHLRQLDCQYGDFTAHNNLWDMACKTSGDVMARMALVPRLIEARGLDVAPAMIQRLSQVGDRDGVTVLEIIHREEIEHVRIGNRWYLYCCEQRDLPPRESFFQLLQDYAGVGYLSGPFDRPSRLAAGFDERELDELAALAMAR